MKRAAIACVTLVACGEAEPRPRPTYAPCTVGTLGCTCSSDGTCLGEAICNALDRCVDANAAHCPNGIVEVALGEQCDGANLGGATCGSIGFASGTLTCSSSCTYNTSGCQVSGTCNNGTLDTMEECEGFELRGQTCAGLGYEGGTLRCTQNCMLDASDCYGCGNCPPPAVCINNVCSACREDGVSCTSGAECCTGVCSAGRCGLPCGAAGVSCALSSQCCSGHCHPSEGRCCLDPGQTCTSSLECCSGSCQNGSCACGPPYSGCDSASQCCPGSDCQSSTCCALVGGACSSRYQCCDPSNECTGECCSVGACSVSSDCCDGPCTNGRCCTPLGSACNAGSLYQRCCSGACNMLGGSNKCCKDRYPSSDTCSTAAECCDHNTFSSTLQWVASLCVSGRCCSPTGAYCRYSQQCCSGVCNTYVSRCD